MMHPDNMNDFYYQQYMEDQWAASQTWFTCQVCEQQLGVAEKERNGYRDTCKPCAAEIEKDIKDLGL